MKFRKFKAGNILNFTSSKGVFHACNVIIKDKKSDNYYPYVVRTSKNNGIRGYISEDINKLNPANTISFAQDTAQMFYQEESYYTGNKVKVLSIKDHAMTDKIAIYLITCLNKAFCNFAWGSSYDTKLLQEVEISLPVTESEEIDWDFMERYIKAIEKVVIKDVVEWKDAVIEKTKEVVA